jgi:hypothetical protein
VRTFNLADNELKSIAAFASRIAVLLSKPDIKADDDQTGVLDDLLGAVYAASQPWGCGRGPENH